MFSIDNPTLNRFYSFHYTLPFLLAGLSIFHIAALHQYGSTNPLGINTQGSTIPFGTYFTSKDLLGFLFLLLAFAILVFFFPEYLGRLMAVQFSNILNYYNAICWDHFIDTIVSQIYFLQICLPIFCADFPSWFIFLFFALCLNFVINFETAKILKYGQSQSAGNNVDSIYKRLDLVMWNQLSINPVNVKRKVNAFSKAPLFCYFGSSETLRVTFNSIPFYVLSFPFSTTISQQPSILGPQINPSNSKTYNHFNTWLAGFIDGDGYLGLYNNKPATIDITLDAKDVPCLYEIQSHLGFGTVTKRTGVNAYRYRILKKENVLIILNLINGYLLIVIKWFLAECLCVRVLSPSEQT